MEKIIFTLEKDSAEQLKAWRGITTEKLESLLYNTDDNGDPNPQIFQSEEEALEALSHCTCRASYRGKSFIGEDLFDVEVYTVQRVTLDEDGDAIAFDFIAEAEWAPLPAELLDEEN